MFSLFKLCFKLSKLLKTSWGWESFSPVGFFVLRISGCLQWWLSFSCVHRAPGRRVWKGMCGLLWKAAACCSGVQQQSETGSQAASWAALPPLLFSLCCWGWLWGTEVEPSFSLCWMSPPFTGVPIGRVTATRGCASRAHGHLRGWTEAFVLNTFLWSGRSLEHHIWQFSLMLQFCCKWNMTTQQLQ